MPLLAAMPLSSNVKLLHDPLTVYLFSNCNSTETFVPAPANKSSTAAQRDDTSPASPQTQPTTRSPNGFGEKFATLAADIKISHTIFALPFALLGAILAVFYRKQMATQANDALLIVIPELDGDTAYFLDRWPVPFSRWLGMFSLVIICMVFARTLAMAINRLADANIDASNPRTKGRALPSGKLTISFMKRTVLLCAIGFALSASGFWMIDNNPSPLILSPFVLAYLAAYSYLKRFTWLCHLYLGSALALSPITAAIAIEPRHVLNQPDILLLAGMVMCWVAGFDIIYALQDLQSDRKAKLHSIPARFGAEGALWISRLLHLTAIGALIALTLTSNAFGTAFAIGVGLVIALLILEHALVWNSKTNRMHMAFFTVNGIISLVLGGLGIFDIVRNISH